MIGLVTGAILNIALAPALIFGAGRGIFGAGLATAICQTISFTILTVMCVKVGVVRLSPRWFQPDMLLIREMIGGGTAVAAAQRRGVGGRDLRESGREPVRRCGDRGHGDRQPHRVDRQLDDRRFRTRGSSRCAAITTAPVCSPASAADFWFGVRVETAILVCATVVFALFAPELVGLFGPTPT